MSSEGGALLLSVIVPTHGRACRLQNLLDDFRTAADHGRLFDAPIELLVVCDGPQDGIDARLRRLPRTLRARCLTQPHAGPAAARNLALRHARGEWLLFLDDDIRIRAETLIGHMERIAAAPRGCHAYLGRCDLAGSVIDSAWRAVLAHSPLLYFAGLRPDRTYGYRFFRTRNLSVRAEFVREVGGFRPALGDGAGGAMMNFHEDIELGWRLQHDFDVDVRFVPEIPGEHEHPLTPRDYFEREHRAGRAAAAVRDVNRRFHDETWPWVGDASAQFAALRSSLSTSLTEARRELESLSQRPASDMSRSELRLAYLALLPLRRAAFLGGYAGREFGDLWPDEPLN